MIRISIIAHRMAEEGEFKYRVQEKHADDTLTTRCHVAEMVNPALVRVYETGRLHSKKGKKKRRRARPADVGLRGEASYVLAADTADAGPCGLDKAAESHASSSKNGRAGNSAEF